MTVKNLFIVNHLKPTQIRLVFPWAIEFIIINQLPQILHKRKANRIIIVFIIIENLIVITEQNCCKHKFYALFKVHDVGVIQQIENLLKPRTDFWDELNDLEKAAIKQGLNDLEQGKRVDFQEFMKERRQRQTP